MTSVTDQTDQTHASPRSDLGASVDKAIARSESKRHRYRLLTEHAGLWDISSLERVRKCRRCSVGEGGAVGLRITSDSDGDRSAGFSGLAKCGSVWACPVCAAKIARQRADDLGQVLAWSIREGHTVALLSATLQHHRGQSLAKSWDAVNAGWSRITQGRAWVGETDTEYQRKLDRWREQLEYRPTRRRGERANTYRRRCQRRYDRIVERRPVRKLGLQDEYGVIGWVRASEATHGFKHGWHPHIHVVMVFEGTVSEDQVRELGDRLYTLWEKGLASKGYKALRRVVRADGVHTPGLDIKVCRQDIQHELAQYFVKQLAMEATHGIAKKGRTAPLERTPNRTPFQILADFQATGDADLHRLWREWEEASHGRKQLTWSVGLKTLAGLAEDEPTDQEIVDQDLGDEDLMALPAETWKEVRDEQVELLLAAESGGLAAAKSWLDERGLPYLIKLPPAPEDVAGLVAPALRYTKPVVTATADTTQPECRCRRCGERLQPDRMPFGQHAGDCLQPRISRAVSGEQDVAKIIFADRVGPLFL